MKNVTGIYEGEILEMEERTNANGKTNTALYLISGRQIIKILVNKSDMISRLKSIPDRSFIKIRAIAKIFKEDIFLNAIEIIE